MSHVVRSAGLALLGALMGCGDPGDAADDPNQPGLDAGPTDGGTPDGFYGDSGTTPDGSSDARPSCDDAQKQCAATFTYEGTATSVELRGDFRTDGWTKGAPLAKDPSGVWKAAVEVPFSRAVHYKLVLDGTTWITDPKNPDKEPDGFGGSNSVRAATACADYTCKEPEVPPPGVFDWRDAVVYFVFVDRFLNGDPTNDGPKIAGVDDAGQYQGGDFAGVKQKVDEGYFEKLGVNTLWLTVPVMNADDYGGLGVGGDPHRYSSYHGYWPRDVSKTEPRFGTLTELTALVAAAHTHKLKVLFDYAMVHVHESAPVYAAHADWFHPSGCICGSGACPWEAAGDRCWFTGYLPHWNFKVKEARDYSVGNAVQWVKDTGIDGFRLDAIKHVDGSWLTDLRGRIETEITPKSGQRFYMVGETYDFGNRDYLRSFVDPKTKLDGQFDFPLRLRLLTSVLTRKTGMGELASFMDGNDGFYGPDAVMSTWIGNHDLGRVIHMAEDTPMWGDPYSDGKDKAWAGRPSLPTYRAPFERLANAFAVLFTNKGAPLIYYGDEIGLAGAGDPDNRRPMTWTGLSADQSWLSSRVGKLLSIRAAHPALRRGTRKTLLVNDDVWVYSQSTAGDTVYVVVNRGDATVNVSSLPPGSYDELVEGAAASAPLSVPPRQTRILIAK